MYRGKNKLHYIILNNNKGKTAAYSVKEYKMKIILYKFSPIHSFPYTFFPIYILSPRGPTGYILLVTNTYEIISWVHERRHVQVRSA